MDAKGSHAEPTDVPHRHKATRGSGNGGKAITQEGKGLFFACPSHPASSHGDCSSAALEQWQHSCSTHGPEKCAAIRISSAVQRFAHEGSKSSWSTSSRALEDWAGALKATPTAVEFRINSGICDTNDTLQLWCHDVVLHNVGYDTILFLVLPPASPAFSVFLPQCKSSLCAGMSQRIQVRFDASARAPEADCLNVYFTTRAAGTPSVGRRKTDKKRAGQNKSIFFRKVIPVRATFDHDADQAWRRSLSDSLQTQLGYPGDEAHLSRVLLNPRIDFGCVKVGGFVERRLVLPIPQWKASVSMTELAKESSVFSVKPQLRNNTAESPTTFLIGRGVPLDIAHRSQAPLTYSLQETNTEKGPRHLQAALSDVLEPELQESCASQVEAFLEVDVGRSLGNGDVPFQGSDAVDDSRESMTTESNLRSPSKCLEHENSATEPAPSAGIKCDRLAAKMTKRFEPSNRPDSIHRCFALDQRWDNLAATLRLQRLGAHTVKGAALPSAVLLEKVLLARSHNVRRLLNQTREKDILRNKVGFGRAPLVSSQDLFLLPRRSPAAEAQSLTLRQQWHHDLRRRFQRTVVAVTIRARAFTRLSLLWSWIHASANLDKVSQDGVTQHQNQNFRGKPQQGSLTSASTESCTTEGVLTGVRGSSGESDKVSGGLCGAAKAARSVEEVPAPEAVVQTPTEVHKEQQHEQTQQVDWEAKLTLPRFLVPLESTGEMETEDIPCPHLWDAGHLDVGELFSCLQNDSPLRPLPQRDAELFRLEEAEVISCIGGLEVKDGDFLQSLAEATTLLVEDKAWRPWRALEPQAAIRDAKQMAAPKLDALHTAALSGGARIFPSETSFAFQESAWRLLAPYQPTCGACMQMSKIVETDLSYCFCQLAAEPEFGDGSSHILPPFISALPVKSCAGEALSVSCEALWKLGGCQTHEDGGRGRLDYLGANIPSLDTIIEPCRDKPQEKRLGAEALPIGTEEAFHLAQEESILRAASSMKESKVFKDVCLALRQEQLKRLRSLNASLPAELQVT
ncbi:hypothetical protein Esti_001150 [Eimeria stiedai]